MLVRGTPMAAGAELRQPASWNESGATKSPGFSEWLKKQTSAEGTPKVADQRAPRSAVDEGGTAKKTAEEKSTARASEDAEVAPQTREPKVTKSRKLVTKTSAEKSAKAGAKAGAKADVETDAEKKQAIKQGVARGNVPRSKDLSTSAGDTRRVGDGPEQSRGKAVQAKEPSGSARAKLTSKDGVATKAALRKTETSGARTQGSAKRKEAVSKETTRRDEDKIVERQIPAEESAVQGLTADSSGEAREGTGDGASTSLKAASTKADLNARALRNGKSRQKAPSPDGGGKAEGRQNPVADAHGKSEQARTVAEELSTPRQVRSPSEAGRATKPVHLRASAQVADSKGPSAPVDTGRVSTTPVRVDVSAPAPSDANAAPLKSAAPFHQLVEQGLDQLLSSPQGTMVRQLQLQLSGAQSAHIRLSLQPESLGEVRLFVQLHDRNAVTQIKVDNAQTGQLMENALESFARSFSDNGYQQQRFEVVVEPRRVTQGNVSAGSSSAGARPLAQVWFDQQQVNYMA